MPEAAPSDTEDSLQESESWPAEEAITPEPGSESEPGSEPETDFETEPELKLEPEPEEELKPKVETQPEFTPEPEPQLAFEPETEVPSEPEPIQNPETRPAGHRVELEKAAQLGLNPRESAGVIAGARHANLRRTPHFAKILVLALLANLLIVVPAGFWIHRRLVAELDNRIASGGATQTGASEDQSSVRLERRMEEISNQLAEAEEQNRKQASRLEEVAAALATAKGSPATITPPAIKENPASTQSDLLLLKERNRLTNYADEAIATGAREPYERLWQAIDDPRLANLAHAARSEILRVQNFYLGGSRIDRFDIPVADYFPGDSALRDSQLKDEQLIKLLLEKKNPWEVRMKAANLLTTRRSLEVGEALVQAVKNDDNLDVVKEATFSFEAMTGFRARIFDTDSLVDWWTRYKTTPIPVKPKDKDKGTEPKPQQPDAKSGAGNESPPPGKEEAPKATTKSPSKSSDSKSKKK